MPTISEDEDDDAEYERNITKENRNGASAKQSAGKNKYRKNYGKPSNLAEAEGLV